MAEIGTELTGVLPCHIKKRGRPHTAKVSYSQMQTTMQTAKVNGRPCETHKEVRHDFRRPQEEAYRSICDVPACSREKGGGRTVL